MENLNYDYFEDRARNPVEEHRRRVMHQITIRRELRRTTNPLKISATEFYNLYRMPQHVFSHLVEIVRPHMERRTSPLQVSLRSKVLCAVHFYASGSYQRPTGRSADLNISQAMVSKCIHEVTNALNSPDVIAEFIKFPTTFEERERVIARNTHLGMPRTLGFIDGTLIKIFPPSREKQVYRSRKGFTAINAQIGCGALLIVCDADLNILNVNARFPGSAVDPYIYRSSPVRGAMMDAYRDNHCWLLGDSAYPHEPWLMKPIENAVVGSPEYHYTKLHCRCRNAVERCIGVLKAVWRCLNSENTLHYQPEKAGAIINACVVLHNFLRRHRNNVRLPEPEYEDFGGDRPEEPLEEDANIVEEADQIRAALVEHAEALWRVRFENL